MDVNVFKECEIVMSNDSINGRKRFGSEAVNAIEIQLKKGGKIPEHGTEESVFFYVLEGRGKLSINGESGEIEGGMVAFCPANISKSIENNSKSLLRVLVVKMK